MRRNIIFNVFLAATFFLLAATVLLPTSEVMAAKKGKSSKTESVKLKKILRDAYTDIQKENYADSTMKSYAVIRYPGDAKYHSAAKYFLAIALLKMGLKHAAIEQFEKSMKTGWSKYSKKSFALAIDAAEQLGDLGTASRIIDYVAKKQKKLGYEDRVAFRNAEKLFENGKYKSALQAFLGIGAKSPLYGQALYGAGTSAVYANQLKKALIIFYKLRRSRLRLGEDDPILQLANLAMARIYYQGKNYSRAIQYYLLIHRNSKHFRTALFESAWAYFLKGNHIKALGNLHAIHSPFYYDHYNPESMFLRALIYFSLCKYSDMKKTLQLFSQKYFPIFKQIKQFDIDSQGASDYIERIVQISRDFSELKAKHGHMEFEFKSDIPPAVVQKITEDEAIGVSFRKRVAIANELEIAQKVPNWDSTEAGKYIIGRLQSMKEQLDASLLNGVRAVLLGVQKELIFFQGQRRLANIEMLELARTRIKENISGKTRVMDEDKSRSFYAQNGWEYYPFTGEYWADELGTYLYLGVTECQRVLDPKRKAEQAASAAAGEERDLDRAEEEIVGAGEE